MPGHKRTQGKENVEYAAGDAEGFRYAYRTHFSDSFHKIFSKIFEEEADPFVSDIQVKLSLSFSEAVKGCTKDLSFDAFVPCDSCYVPSAFMLPGVFPEASAIPFGEGMVKGLKGQDLGGMDGEHICHRVDTLLHMDMEAYY
nr:chaperone protein dnaj 1, mitochondrial [Quercus suber]